MCFISTIHVDFIHRSIIVCKYYFVFIFPIFIFHITLKSFREMYPSQEFPGATYWMGVITENSVTRRSYLEGHSLPFGSVSTSVIPSRQDKQYSCVTISRRDLSPMIISRMRPYQLFLISYLVMVDMILS